MVDHDFLVSKGFLIDHRDDKEIHYSLDLSTQWILNNTYTQFKYNIKERYYVLRGGDGHKLNVYGMLSIFGIAWVNYDDYKKLYLKNENRQKVIKRVLSHG